MTRYTCSILCALITLALAAAESSGVRTDSEGHVINAQGVTLPDILNVPPKIVDFDCVCKRDMQDMRRLMAALKDTDLALALKPAGDEKPELSEVEKKDGWVLLFDGTTTTGWKKIGSKEFPKEGWDVVDGCLHRSKGKGGGDIITVDAYENFELSLEWKISSGGNSGVKYRIQDSGGAGFGPEMQVLDDSKHADGKNPKTSAGALYLLYAPNDKKKLKPVGEFNTAKLVVNNNKVEHWLNGEKVVEYEIGTDEWKTLVAATKYKDPAKFAQPAKGHILLQDHGNEVWFRNIKIRVLDKK